MIGRCLIAALLAAFVVGHVHAFVDPPIIDPSKPISGQLVDTVIRVGQCDAFADLPHQIELEIAGNTIRLIVDGLRRNDPLWCMFPPVVHRYPLGSYPPGDYLLEVYLRYPEFFGPNIRIDLVGTATFSVAGARTPPQPVPSIRGVGIVVLVVLLLLVGRHRCVARGSSAL